MYCEMTRMFKIEVEPAFIPEESNPMNDCYVFTYRIKITNEGAIPAQLLSRHWIITDGFGATQEVKGPGVVGAQPNIQPGQTFEYSSFCPLPTPSGNMRGTYQMVDENNQTFDIKIPLFFLRDQRSYH